MNILSLAEKIITMAIPGTELQLFWFVIGAMLSRTIFKPLDYNIKETDWFKERHVVFREVFSRVLDFTHHWWAGLLLMFYTPSRYTEILYYIGSGVFIADLPDFYRRVKGLWESISEYLNDDE